MKKLMAILLTLCILLPVVAIAEHTEWTCPQCGTVCKSVQNFCITDGHPAPWVWTCNACGTERNNGDTCKECGKPQTSIPTVEPEPTEAPTPAPATPKPVVVLTPPAKVTDADGKLTAEGIVYYYKQGVAYQEAEHYEDAVECYKKIVEQNINYKDSAARLQTCQETAQRIAEELAYQQAMEKLQAGAVTEAYKLFSGIRGYRDVDELLANNDDLLIAAEIQYDKVVSLFRVGNIVTFGHYEQDNDVGNGKEEIEWIVLDQVDGKALLLSKYGLDCKPYNSTHREVTWETCDLRTWLNDIFINQAFTASEQSGIVLTSVDNSQSQGDSKWRTTGGNDTEDKVFLLSYAEANKYLGVTYDNTSNTKSRESPTAYARANGVSVSSRNTTADGQNAGDWWLRSPGRFQDSAALVTSNGSRNYLNVHTKSIAVRPTLWVNLESGIF